MTSAERHDGEPAGPSGRFADDLVGLDPHDPEAQAFAAHLDRMQKTPSPYTVEGYLDQVGDFADSANRVGGGLRLTAAVVAGLILLGVLVALSGAFQEILFILIP